MTPTMPEKHNQIIAYFPEWGVSQPYYVKNIQQAGSAGKGTIVNYAFGLPAPDPQTNQIVCQIADPQVAYGQRGMGSLMQLTPNVKFGVNYV